MDFTNNLIIMKTAIAIKFQIDYKLIQNPNKISLFKFFHQSRRRTQSGQLAEALLNPYEFNLLLQSIILYTIMTALILEWKLLGGVSIIWQAALIEAPYLLFCGLNPFLYLLMNMLDIFWIIFWAIVWGFNLKYTEVNL